jgi:hypothetical protein
MIDKNQLKEIIKDLIEVCKELDINISDEILLRESATYQRGAIANENRNTKSEEKPFSPSIKQYKILVETGLSKEQISKMSKVEVSKLIGEYLSSHTGEEESRESKEVESKTKAGSSQPCDSTSKESLKVSPGQMKALIKHGYTEQEVSQMTYQDAWNIINQGVKSKKEVKKEYPKEPKDKYPETYL